MMVIKSSYRNKKSSKLLTYSIKVQFGNVLSKYMYHNVHKSFIGPNESKKILDPFSSGILKSSRIQQIYSLAMASHHHFHSIRRWKSSKVFF